jgi:acetyl-CoA carboxylase / biotin carboxylase 1
LHEYADSQFGHLFAHGNDRDDARKSLILALKELSIRGEVHTPVEYLISLLQTDQFKKNKMDTSSLDTLIHSKSIQEQKPDLFIAVICAAVYNAFLHYKECGESFCAATEQGHVPLCQLVPYFDVHLNYEDIRCV